MLTLDANVFVSALARAEVQHGISDAFLSRLGQQGIVCYCPTLILPETAAALVRPTRNVTLARQATARIINLPGLSLVALTHTRADLAAAIATNHRLRGADAVYLQVAQEFGTVLVTWDAEMLTRGAAVVTTQTPTDWLARQTSDSDGNE